MLQSLSLDQSLPIIHKKNLGNATQSVLALAHHFRTAGG